MERQNFCQKLYGIKQKAFRATFVNRWSSGVIRVVPSFLSSLAQKITSAEYRLKTQLENRLVKWTR